MSKNPDETKIDESLDETFPASDPPSYMPPEKRRDKPSPETTQTMPSAGR